MSKECFSGCEGYLGLGRLLNNRPQVALFGGFIRYINRYSYPPAYRGIAIILDYTCGYRSNPS
jgi:hypothetical protein